MRALGLGANEPGKTVEPFNCQLLWGWTGGVLRECVDRECKHAETESFAEEGRLICVIFQFSLEASGLMWGLTRDIATLGVTYFVEALGSARELRLRRGAIPQRCSAIGTLPLFQIKSLNFIIEKLVP